MSDPDPVFVRARCTACNDPDVWLTCNACGERHHFVKHDDHVACDCGAKYAHARCTCGAEVPIDRLDPVPFAQGPVRPDDFEIAWERVAVLGVVALAAVGGLGWCLSS